MRTDEEFDRLEQEEHDLTQEEIALLLVIFADAKEDIISELERFYRKYGKNGVVTYADARKYVSIKDRRRRMAVLFANIRSILGSAVGEVMFRVSNLMDDLIEKENAFFETDLPEDVNAIDNKPNWGVDELNWYNRLLENEELWLAYLLSILKQSWVRQRTLDEVVNLVDHRFDTMENALTRLIGTEATALTSLERREIFKRLGIKRYRYYTRADERVCEQCRPMHGMEFPINQYEVGVTAPPMHPNCRDWTVPITD